MASPEEKESSSIEEKLKEGGERTENVARQFADVKMATILTGEANARGIPNVAFIENVEQLLQETTGSSVESLIGAFNELHQKFKLLEQAKVRTRASMKIKIPEIQKTLELVSPKKIVLIPC